MPSCPMLEREACDPAFVLRVLATVAEHEQHDDLHWRSDSQATCWRNACWR